MIKLSHEMFAILFYGLSEEYFLKNHHNKHSEMRIEKSQEFSSNVYFHNSSLND